MDQFMKLENIAIWIYFKFNNLVYCITKIFLEENKNDPESEEYFRELSLDRATVPAEYNAVTKGKLG